MEKFNRMLAGCEPSVLSIFRIITGLLIIVIVYFDGLRRKKR